MRILVTGGAGFIGSHITDALLERGHEVHVLDDLSGGRRHLVNPDARFHEMDIRSDSVGTLWKAHEFEVMYHLAAQMDVRRSVADPSFDADVNLGGLLNLMEAGRRNGLGKVVFSSTGGAIYGEPESVPQSEDHTTNPLSPYGITKLCTEKYLAFYELTYGISFVALRYGNVYGPRQNPHGEAGVVAIFAEKLMADHQPVINGDGTQTRDYVYVADVVEANMRALDLDSSQTINIGTGIETDVNKLFRVLRDRLAPDMGERHAPAKPGEQQRSVLGWERAHKVLEWQPSVPIEEGLVRTADWFRNHASNGS